ARGGSARRLAVSARRYDGRVDEDQTDQQDAPRCRLCGIEITEPEYEDTGLCGDCYWDDQTNADGSVGEDE
ncbi:MAG: hypothetical protein ACXVP8_02805, partial [Actinomycetota bacterium]